MPVVLPLYMQGLAVVKYSGRGGMIYPDHPAVRFLLPNRITSNRICELVDRRNENVRAEDRTSALIAFKVQGDTHLMDVFARLNNGRREVCGKGCEAGPCCALAGVKLRCKVRELEGLPSLLSSHEGLTYKDLWKPCECRANTWRCSNSL
jgi:hypothetical protein